MKENGEFIVLGHYAEQQGNCYRILARELFDNNNGDNSKYLESTYSGSETC
jgi:hypothetical protein